MAIELTESESPMIPARTVKAGSGDFVIATGKTLSIETSPDGVELLNITVPDGKTWTAHVDVTIVEIDIT